MGSDEWAPMRRRPRGLTGAAGRARERTDLGKPFALCHDLPRLKLMSHCGPSMIKATCFRVAVSCTELLASRGNVELAARRTSVWPIRRHLLPDWRRRKSERRIRIPRVGHFNPRGSDAALNAAWARRAGMISYLPRLAPSGVNTEGRTGDAGDGQAAIRRDTSVAVGRIGEWESGLQAEQDRLRMIETGRDLAHAARCVVFKCTVPGPGGATVFNSSALIPPGLVAARRARLRRRWRAGGPRRWRQRRRGWWRRALPG